MKTIDPPTALPVGKLAASSNWQAHLALGFADDDGVTRLFKRTHSGPLRVQKALYPEGPQLCHTIVVHPPGGVVGGDELEIDVEVGGRAHAFITTPGAAKWYKANGKISLQKVQLNVAGDAKLEWLPQETIFFDDAHVRLENAITLEKNASFIGCEILCFGRTASGEAFRSGRVEQRTSIRQEGKLLWLEQGFLSANSGVFNSLLGLNGKTVCATLIAVGKVLPASKIAELRSVLADVAESGDEFGATQMKSVVVVRCLGNSSESAKRIMGKAWQVLRPPVVGIPAVVPRIWNT